MQQLDAAVNAANDAFTAWSALSWDERSQYLLRGAVVIEQNIDSLAYWETREGGLPIEFAKAEIGAFSLACRYFAGLRLPEEIVEDSATRRVRVIRRPLGVVAAITPWNFPFDVLSLKLPAALIAGNTMVVKPAGTTPLATLQLGRLLATVLPPGVVNVISDANDLGEALTQHPGVRKISFTGSTATGQCVMKNAADSLKRVTLELGGNDPAIVLDDANAREIAPDLAFWAFFHAGQVCVGLKRLYVPAALYDELCDELAAIARAIKVGNGMEAGVQMGPLQNRKQYERAKLFLSDAECDGTIIAGGNIIEGPGFFVQPTVVRDIEDGSPLVDEEQFAPILPVVKYRDLDELIRQINQSPYGLGASVWSRDLARATAVAERLNCGTVWINKHCDVAPHIPFAGAKSSGVGVEFGEAGLLEFTQLQVINVPGPSAVSGPSNPFAH